MGAEAAALSRSWPVGKYTATMTVPKAKPGTVASVSIEWAPHPPQRLTAEEIDQYRIGRHQALAALGVRALVVEV